VSAAVRGQVIQADLGLDEPKLLVVVSNNSRNAHLGSVLAVRLTTSPKRPRSSIVEIADGETVTGRAICDDLLPVYDDEILTIRGALSPRTMRAIDRGLAAALALTLA
jgi:mRNA interferase MazF